MPYETDDYTPDQSADRVARMRGHRGGDHSGCLYKTCKTRRNLEYANEAHLLAVTAFELLAERGMDARKWWGNGYAEARELADAELPDFEYLPRVPDSLLRLKARVAISTT